MVGPSAIKPKPNAPEDAHSLLFVRCQRLWQARYFLFFCFTCMQHLTLVMTKVMLPSSSRNQVHVCTIHTDLFAKGAQGRPSALDKLCLLSCGSAACAVCCADSVSNTATCDRPHVTVRGGGAGGGGLM